MSLGDELREKREKASNKCLRDHEKSLNPTLDALPGTLKPAAKDGKSSCRIFVPAEQYEDAVTAKKVLDSWAYKNGVVIKQFIVKADEQLEVQIGW